MIKTFKASVAALAVLGLALGGAQAQSNSLKKKDVPVSNPGELLPSLHAEAVVSVLDEMGIEYQGATLPNGQKVLLAKAKNGIKFQLTPTACDKGGLRCRGISMVALFKSNAPDRAISAFDQHYVFVSAGMQDEGVAYLTRYDLADFGIPKGNLAVSLMNYVHMATIFDRHLYEATNTVALPSASDLSGESLNMKAILASSDLANSLGYSEESHQVSFELLPDVVNTFVKADDLAPGRLVNSVTGSR